ncbi:response regulator transcription factor [Pedobacter xixiisoli]|uniref:Response regulator receiver domain-containing protein n=1 Tax=Pedobacter xixiisoli TaxID=1476464 RepID=A0A285ZVZ1_9SPHI|nr:response regulator [Pedobacter xixiisoli]SOD13796.1 Response regulator receiver domain-containing protein [Pedobacter xixiisoli]
MAKRILIIEDDPDILDILDIIFQDEGYDIISRRNGMSANEIGLLHPDLVLLDVRISGFEKTGSQICKELKALTDTNNLPVLLLSAEKNLNLIANGCGADGYISKPFDIIGLTRKVREMIKY